jgi:hypothetical protein
MLAAIPILAFAGNREMAAALIIVERIGKAIRTPARDTILSHATMAVGMGWGFGDHKALDQVGAVAGPPVILAALVVTGGYMDGFLVLAIPLIGVAVALFLALVGGPVTTVPGSGGKAGRLHPFDPALCHLHIPGNGRVCHFPARVIPP